MNNYRDLNVMNLLLILYQEIKQQKQGYRNVKILKNKVHIKFYKIKYIQRNYNKLLGIKCNNI